MVHAEWWKLTESKWFHIILSMTSSGKPRLIDMCNQRKEEHLIWIFEEGILQSHEKDKIPISTNSKFRNFIHKKMSFPLLFIIPSKSTNLLRTLIIMNTSIIPLLACVLMGSTISNLVRAPAPTTSDDCDCQCEGTTYLDEDGLVQGNCRAADSSGRKWCYVSEDISTKQACKDSFGYDSRYNMSKSYAACSSPDPATEQCDFAYVHWYGI